MSEQEPVRDGDMGVSSERVGPTGPGQVGRAGERDVSPHERDPEQDVSPERADDAEENPTGLPPKAGYPSADPRSAERPYDPS